MLEAVSLKSLAWWLGTNENDFPLATVLYRVRFNQCSEFNLEHFLNSEPALEGQNKLSQGQRWGCPSGSLCIWIQIHLTVTLLNNNVSFVYLTEGVPVLVTLQEICPPTVLPNPERSEFSVHCSWISSWVMSIWAIGESLKLDLGFSFWEKTDCLKNYLYLLIF